jgi:hypothetical protein
MYKNFFSHPQLTPLRVFIIWQLVSTSSVDRHQAIVKEHECVQVHVVSVCFHFQVGISCQKINSGKIVRCVYLKNVYTFGVTPKGLFHVKIIKERH